MKQVITIISVFGPAALVSVELFDPASIVAATAAGAAVGLAVLWATFYSGILLIWIQEISARLGVVTRKTLPENMHQRFGPDYSRRKMHFIAATYDYYSESEQNPSLN